MRQPQPDPQAHLTLLRGKQCRRFANCRQMCGMAETVTPIHLNKTATTMIPIAATANAARRAPSLFFSEGVGKWKMIHPAHEGKHSKSVEALNLNLDLNNLRVLFDNSCVAASKKSDQFLFLLEAVMNPCVATVKAAYQSPSSFFSEDVGPGGFSLKSIKSSATKLWRHTCWVAFAVCAFSTGCKQSTQAPALPPPPVTVATPVHKEIVEWDEYTARTEAVESVQVRLRVSGYIDPRMES